MSDPNRRVTGSADIPLTQEGQRDAKASARALSHKFDRIFCGPEKRHVDTAEKFGNPIIVTGLDAWKRGGFEGKPSHTTKKTMGAFMLHADRVPPGKSPLSGEKGESYNQFLKPYLRVTQAIIEHRKPQQRLLVVTSGGNLQAEDAYGKAGSPKDFKFDHSEIAKKAYWTEPGQLFLRSKTGLEKVDDNDSPGVYFLEHSFTKFNPPKK